MVSGNLLQVLMTGGIGFCRRKVVPTFQEKKDSMRVAPWVVATIVVVFLCLFIGMPPVLAGPPFRTDDPEPVEYEHWEFYLASQYANDKDGVSSTAPHLEVNYGVLPNVQLHLIVPFGYDRPRGGPTLYGFQDLELGVKYRFIQETDCQPMVGIFPVVHIPTGSTARGLGSGEVQLFLPLWLQKAWGPWQTYGGGGYWINPGTDNKNYWFFGWQVQRAVANWLTVGAEIFYQTPPVRNGEYQTGYNIGAIINFTENHHLLCSAGSDIHGQNLFSYYLAYQWTWGPKEKKK
jgi:hypothetical protein